ncbi:site-specific DNA-methyltransferase [Corynebacterium parakroppenstedtii]|uniref:site-specific DNA-methyltransferase n=1 Tax=Corynebacterium parakroppenstedtii TaxID=2828363 RepID=UPI001C8F92C6|nr:site-specific DNA-methyltransferase [Corynebacterium parakroppenstedtii]MBY0795232.1 site-specific DNA-methyltransferase [Corynebacterium parakroppenstedtii]
MTAMIKDALDKNENVTPASFNLERFQMAFPEFFDSTGAFKFEDFKSAMTNQAVDFSNESYKLDFVGRSYAEYMAGLETETVIVPDTKHNSFPENKDSGNIYIVGDNLDALKHLKKSYKNSIKCIYIDPPYNTGSDGFVYNDFFGFTVENLIDKVGLTEEEAERTVALNGKSTHSAWLTFMLPRLKIAAELLANDGVIFISIDDNEDSQLRIICDDIFGAQNRVSTLAWSVGAGTQAGHFTRAVESVLVYAKNINSLPFFKGGEGVIEDRATKQISSKNPASEITFPAGFPWHAPDGSTLSGTWGGAEKITLVDGIMEAKNGVLLNEVTLSAGWSMSNQIKRWIRGEETTDSKGQSVVGFHFNKSGGLRYTKEKSTVHPSQLLKGKGSTKDGSTEVEKLFGAQVFDFPKPTKLIQFLVSLVAEGDDLVLDFFSGSGTTAHSVLNLNAADGGNRKFIAVQLPEILKAGPTAHSAKNAREMGLSTIDEIGRERIKRAAAEIKEETGTDIDSGFKLFRLEKPQVADLESLERFNPAEGLFDLTNDYVSSMSSGETSGEDIILATLMNRFHKTLTPDLKHIELDGYELPVVGTDAFVVAEGLTNEDVHRLISLIENEELTLNRVIVLHYSVGFPTMKTLKSGLNNMKNSRDVDLVEVF